MIVQSLIIELQKQNPNAELFVSITIDGTVFPVHKIDVQQIGSTIEKEEPDINEVCITFN